MKNRRIMSTSLPPILALAVPVYGSCHAGNSESKLATAFSESIDKQGNIISDPAFSKKRKTGVDQMERAAKRKKVMVPALSPAIHEESEEEIATPTCKIRTRSGKSEPLLRTRNMRFVPIESKVAARSVEGNRNKVSAFTPAIDEEVEQENNASPTYDAGIRSQMPIGGEGNGSVVSMVRATRAVMVKAKMNGNATILSPPTDECDTFVKIPRSKLLHSGKGNGSDASINVPAAARVKAKKKGKKIPVLTPSTNKQGAEKIVVPIPHTRIRKCGTHFLSSENGSKRMFTGSAKKKLKKNIRRMRVRIGENTDENSSCCNGGINKESSKQFENMLEKFRYTGNKKLQEDGDLCDPSVSVSKETKRQQEVAAVHAPCQELVLSAPQETKKHRKTPHLVVVKSDMLHKSVRCKRGGTMTKGEKTRDCYRRVSPDNTWVPPNSLYGLIQEDHSFDPWRILVICMLLNQTTGAQVKKVIGRVFLVCPTAEAAVQVSTNELTTIISSLGLQNKRARDIREMSRQYLEDWWTHVTQLHGIGKYAADAYAIFCVGKPEDVVPKDHMLVKYWEYVVQWRREQQCVAAFVNC